MSVQPLACVWYIAQSEPHSKFVKQKTWLVPAKSFDRHFSLFLLFSHYRISLVNHLPTIMNVSIRTKSGTSSEHLMYAQFALCLRGRNMDPHNWGKTNDRSSHLDAFWEFSNLSSNSAPPGSFFVNFAKCFRATISLKTFELKACVRYFLSNFYFFTKW